jgi:hypothetical protein
MGVFRFVVCGTLAALSLCCSARADSQRLASLFDPARHMRVIEVRPGMKGYGLSVFTGTKIERFDVEVISVLKNFNPKYDVVLIRCGGANLEHTGAIAGMSGSPIYLTDEQGRERLIGAFAYGWPLLKDALAGVQPIEYMLELPEFHEPLATTQPARNAGLDPARGDASIKPQRKIRWNLADSVPLPGMRDAPKTYPLAHLDTLEPNPKFLTTAAAPELQPLATPLMASGLPARVIERCAPLLRAYGLAPLQAGGGGGGSSNGDRDAAPLAPGSVLAAPMLTGDVELTAIGTCTEVLGDRVFGFGHPFNNEGPISLPMGSGEVNGILPSLNQSIKLGSLTKLRGALVADQSVGVAGRLGAVPDTAPIDLRVVYADGTQDVTYHFDCAVHPRLTPALAGLALASAMSGRRDLPEYHTLDYDLKMEFANGQSVAVADTSVNAPAELWAMQTVLLPAMVAADNPFERVMLKRMSGTIRVTAEAREAEVLSVNIPRLKYKPGEKVKAFVTYRPFRAAESILPLEVDLPRDLPDGTYQLVVGDWMRYIMDERSAQPFRFTAENVGDVFAVVKDVMSLRHNALYVRLLRQADGVAVGRVAMARLPSSRRQVMLTSGRSNTTPFVSSTVKVVPTELLMKGSADFSIEISSEARVETAAGANKNPPAKIESHTPPTVTPAPGATGEPKPHKPPKIDTPREPKDPDKPDKPEKPGDKPSDTPGDRDK